MNSSALQSSSISHHIRSSPIAIVKNQKMYETIVSEKENGREKKMEREEKQLIYGLTNSFLDPSNFSPPSNFFQHLKQRIHNY